MLDEASNLDEFHIDEGVLLYDTKAPESVEVDPFLNDSKVIKSLNIDSNLKRKITTLEKRHTGVGKAESKKLEEQVITGYQAFEVVFPPHNQTYLARLYTASPQHYSAINAKVSNIVGLGYDFVESRKIKRALELVSNNQDKTTRIRRKLALAKDDLEDLLDSFNEDEAFSETLMKVWKDYEATGNGYIEIGRQLNGKIGYIGHVPATSVRIRRKRDGFVQIISEKAVFFRNFGATDKNPLGNDNNPNEIIHIKKYSPDSNFYGVPDIISATQAIAGNEFSARFNLDYFENKAVPRHVVILKGATIAPALAKNILEFFETGTKGKNHRSLFVPLPADTADRKVSLEFKPVEAGIQDSSFNNYRKANQEEILMAHRVPVSKVGMAAGVSLAVARDADKTFKEQVCQPEQRILEKKLNRIVSELTDSFVLKLNEMTLTDEDTQSKIDERYLKTGVIKRNEVRARKGLPGIKKGDEIIDINKDAGAKGEATTQRERDSKRSAAATDSAGEARSPKGEGRTQ